MTELDLILEQKERLEDTLSAYRSAGGYTLSAQWVMTDSSRKQGIAQERKMVVTINMRTIFDCQDIWTARKRTIDDEDCSLSIGAMSVSSLTTDTDIAFHINDAFDFRQCRLQVAGGSADGGEVAAGNGYLQGIGRRTPGNFVDRQGSPGLFQHVQVRMGPDTFRDVIRNRAGEPEEETG